MFVTIAVAVAVAIVTGFLSTNNHSSCGSTDIASSMDEDAAAAAAADKSESKSTPSVSDRQGNDACNSEEDEDEDEVFDGATTAVVCKKVGTSKIVVSIPEKDTETWSCNLNRHTQELRIKNLKPL